MDRIKIVLTEVGELYEAESAKKMGRWMWRNHVVWVADTGKKLAEKYGANAEVVYCAALMHDLADCKYERGHKSFNIWSRERSVEILKQAGFNQQETDAVLEAIRTHSCRANILPTAMEGKILATADALFHIQTNFFAVLCYMNRPITAKSYRQWQEWFSEKIEREYHIKIFFDDERAEAKADYEALLRVFGKKYLDSGLN